MRMCHENYGAHCCSPEDELVHFNDLMTQLKMFWHFSMLTNLCRRFVMIVLYPQAVDVKLSLRSSVAVLDPLRMNYFDFWQVMNVPPALSSSEHTKYWIYWNEKMAVKHPDPWSSVDHVPAPQRMNQFDFNDPTTVPLAALLGQTSHLITSSLASFAPALTENLLLLF